MIKILLISFGKLRNAAHYEFMVVFLSLMLRFPTVRSLVMSFFQTFSTLLEEEKHLVDTERKSPLTEKLAEVDKKIDKYITGIKHAVKSNLSHFDPDVVNAAKVLTIRLKALGNVRVKPYEEESADVQVLLDDFRNRFPHEVHVLKLEEWVDQLEIAENEFTQLFEERSIEMVNRPQDSLKKLRKEIDDVYKNMIIVIQADLNINPDPSTLEFAKVLNEQIKYFNEHAHHKIKKDINDANVETIPDQSYTGKQIIVIPVVHYEKEELILGTDFTLTYKKNIESGNAEVIIHGKGSFKSKKIVTFSIKKS
jgi:hypothetical protein